MSQFDDSRNKDPVVLAEHPIYLKDHIVGAKFVSYLYYDLMAIDEVDDKSFQVANFLKRSA